jgi:RNAse (barnase) inhibitor barstar
MSARKRPFVFIGDASKVATEHDFRLKVPKGIESKTDLFSHYAKEGDFPSYFGSNWDALLDCLRDFSWTDRRRIVIIHDDLPLLNNERELCVYLEILETAVNDWKEVREGAFAEPPKNMPYLEHELLVVFPSAVEATIARVLGVQKN